MGIFDKIKLPEVKNIIAIASGKGGVGKSTIAVNLSIALARNGMRVALVDADIFGPSIPKMFGIEDEKPEVTANGDNHIMFPIEKYGVKIMSIGFFVNKEQSLIWRGPMAANAIVQLFETTEWGEIDYMIIDFPPGTSDIQLTCVQKLSMTGAIIVTTPQEIAVADARKAGSMFQSKGLEVPIIGVIENMTWFTPVQHPEEKYFLFGKGGGQKIAEEFKTILLGEIPLVAELGENADKGISVFNLKSKIVSESFEKIVAKILQ